MNKWLSRPAFKLGLVMVLIATVAPAQVLNKRSLRVNVDLVNTYVTVRDNRGRVISTLGKESFVVFEDNVAQTVTHFSYVTEVPLTLALFIDTSGSVKGKLSFEKRAISQFLQEVMRDGDKAALVSFDTFADIRQDYTNDPLLLANSLIPIIAGGGTRLYDSLYSVIQEKLSGSDERKVVVVITDGGDNLSGRSVQDVVELAHRNDVSIYAVSTNQLDPRVSGPDQNDGLLEVLATQTGGRVVFPTETRKLASEFEKLANELHSQYTIAYRSTNSRRDGAFRRIRIETPNHAYSVRTRAGYYAPREDSYPHSPITANTPSESRPE